MTKAFGWIPCFFLIGVLCFTSTAGASSILPLSPTNAALAAPGEYFPGEFRVRAGNHFSLQPTFQERSSLNSIEMELVELGLDGALNANAIQLVPVSWKPSESTLRRLSSSQKMTLFEIRQLSKLSITLWVSADYLSLKKQDGSVFHLPLSLAGVRYLSQSVDFELPTSKVVRQIHRSAAIKLKPIFFNPATNMTKLGYAVNHSKAIAKQIGTYDQVYRLKSGHKKDVVISARKNRDASRLAIYGWIHKRKPVQNQSLFHHQHYVDYSHGIRLIWKYAKIGDHYYSYQKILQDPIWSFLLSDDGPISSNQFLEDREGSG